MPDRWLGFEGSGCRILGVGFGVSDLGFRVWGLRSLKVK